MTSYAETSITDRRGMISGTKNDQRPLQLGPNPIQPPIKRSFSSQPQAADPGPIYNFAVPSLRPADGIQTNTAASTSIH